jgi:light-regulated signal transduction histidine kinase (bacteriophytochrome)
VKVPDPPKRSDSEGEGPDVRLAPESSEARLTRIVERQRVEIVELSREIDSLAYAVSHDLRAPLRSVDGFAQALLEDYEADLDEQGRQYLGFVRESSQQMGRMLDDLVAFSRFARAPLERGPVDVTRLAGRIAERLKRSAPGRAVAVTIQPGLEAQADEDLLGVIFENLLVNAWKFSARRDEARIDVGRGGPLGDGAFFVRDNGVGFDPSTASKLFGAFQKLHPRQDYGGNGMGLAIVRRLVMRHGGRAWAESRPGEGATFFFTLGDPPPAGEP